MNELTGEHSCIVVKELDCLTLYEENSPQSGWLAPFVSDYRYRLISLLSFSLKHLESSLALTLIDPERHFTAAINEAISAKEEEGGEMAQVDTAHMATKLALTNGRGFLTVSELLSVHFTHYDLKRLELYSRNLVDHHMILDLLPLMATLLFSQLRISLLQAAILIGIRLQHRDVDSLAKELDLPLNQVLAFFNKTVRKIASYFRRMIEVEEEKGLSAKTEKKSTEKISFQPSQTSRIERKTSSVPSNQIGKALEQEDEEIEEEDEVRTEQRKLLMANPNLRKHHVKLTDEELQATVGSGSVPKVLSVPKTSNGSDNKELEKDKKKRKHSMEEANVEQLSIMNSERSSSTEVPTDEKQFKKQTKQKSNPTTRSTNERRDRC